MLWWLMKELSNRGHKVKLIAPQGSACPFADVIYPDPKFKTYEAQPIPADVDIVHFDFSLYSDYHTKPYLARQSGNGKPGARFAQNTVFLSQNHAIRHHGEYFIHNGIDIDEYGQPDWNTKPSHVHFLAKAAWKVKNVKGAIEIARKAGQKIEIIGGHRINFKMGFRLTLDRNAHFNGMLGGEKKLNIMRRSKALLFPVLWHEPFGIALIESMYFGCPVIGTPWGSLPEIVVKNTGFLSASISTLVENLKNIRQFDRKFIHEYTVENFSSKKMTDNYLKAYEHILNGTPLNPANPFVSAVEPNELFSLTD
jgi:glycosyltransferase involved in cell wall biosynthesis